MINSLVVEMLNIILKMQEMLVLDIEDVKKARHDPLLERNALKEELMQNLGAKQEELNAALMQALEDEEDMDKYKPIVDTLELELKQLYEKNAKLAKLVMPIKELYHDLVEEISQSNGGSIFEIKV